MIRDQGFTVTGKRLARAERARSASTSFRRALGLRFARRVASHSPGGGAFEYKGRVDACYLSLAAFALLSPLVTLAYAVDAFRRLDGAAGQAEERSVALYLGARCVALAVLAIVAFFVHAPAYLAAIGAANALAQLLDVPVHLMRRRWLLAVAGTTSAIVLAALAGVVAFGGDA